MCREVDFQPKAQISEPSNARGRRGRASPGIGVARLPSTLQSKERNKWCVLRTFLSVFVSSQLFLLLNPKLQKIKGRQDPTDPGLVTQTLTLGWVKLWRKQ